MMYFGTCSFGQRLLSESFTAFLGQLVSVSPFAKRLLPGSQEHNCSELGRKDDSVGFSGSCSAEIVVSAGSTLG